MAGLELVGSRPPSRLDQRPPTSSRYTNRELDSSHRDEEFGQTRTLHSYDPHRWNNGLTNETFSCDHSIVPESGVLSERMTSRLQSSRSVVSERPPSGTGQVRINSSVKRRHRRTAGNGVSSYVDETLFGTRPEEASFAAPWGTSKSKPFVFDCTDYKSVKVRSRPQSARPASVRKLRSGHPTFVDECLFGDQLEPAVWSAPWEKADRSRRPLLFDANDYRVTIKHDKSKLVNEYKGQTNRLTRAGSCATLQKKPPWH